MNFLFGRPLKSTKIRGVPKSEFFECDFGPLSSHPFSLIFPPLFPLQALFTFPPLLPSSPPPLSPFWLTPEKSDLGTPLIWVLFSVRLICGLHFPFCPEEDKRATTNVQNRFVQFFLLSFLLFCSRWAKTLCFEGESPGGKILKKCKKVLKSVKNYETILPFSCCPLVFLWIKHEKGWKILGKIRSKIPSKIRGKDSKFRDFSFCTLSDLIVCPKSQQK